MQSPGMLGTPLRGCRVTDPTTALGEAFGALGTLQPWGPWGVWLAPAPSPGAETPHEHQPSLERRLETHSQGLLL